MNKKRNGNALERLNLEEFKEQEKFPIVVVLDDVRSLANVGSIFRTCDAFNVDELVLCGITGRPPHREIQRTALGATESVAWRYEENILKVVENLRERGYTILCVEQGTQTLEPSEIASLELSQVAFVLGNEVEGVKQSLLDMASHAIEIPQSGTKHSLNVTVAAGIVLWEAYSYYRGRREV